jgi:N-acetylmuramoyl-L-alanine amidase
MRLAICRRRSLPPLVVLWVVALIATATSHAQNVQGTYITTADVQVRRGPGTNYEVIATVPQGIKVQVVGRDGQWLRVQSKQGHPPGYIDEQFVRPLDTQITQAATPSGAGAYLTTSEVNLREGPGTKHKVIRRIPKGIKINVVGGEGNWLRVESRLGNPSGYLDKRFARKLE